MKSKPVFITVILWYCLKLSFILHFCSKAFLITVKTQSVPISIALRYKVLSNTTEVGKINSILKVEAWKIKNPKNLNYSHVSCICFIT